MGGNYWIMIPPTVVGDENLSDSAKLVFGRVFSLTTKEGYCYASNKFLAAGLHLSQTTVSHRLSDLVRRGHIRIDIERNDKKQIVSRHIYPMVKFDYTYGQKLQHPMVKNSKESNKERDIKNSVVENFEIPDFSVKPKKVREKHKKIGEEIIASSRLRGNTLTS